MRRNQFAVVAAIAIGGVQTVMAQTITKYDFNVAAGPRGQVIEEVGKAAGAKVSVADDTAASLAQPVEAVVGKLTLVDALRQVLAGSDWYVIAAANNQVSIGRRDSNMSAVIITGKRQAERKEDSNLLTRSDTLLRETPGTVESVTQTVLDAQNITSIGEALRNLPGVSVNPGPPFQVTSRSRSTNGASFSNGLRNADNGGVGTTIDLASIEVLKGPSSILSGTAVAGGLLNLVPKRATGASPSEVSLGLGSRDYVRGSFDLGGALSEENRLYWRMVGLDERAKELNGGGDNPNARAATFIMGYRGNGWKIDTQTQYYRTRTAFTQLYRNDEPTQSVVRNDLYYKPDSASIDESTAQAAQVEKSLLTSDTLDVRFRTRGRFQHGNSSFSALSCGSCDTGPNNMFLLGNLGKSNQLSSSTDLYAKWTTGELEQQFILAYDFSKSHNKAYSSFNFAQYPASPVPALLPTPNPDAPGVTLNRRTRVDKGFVLQDQLNWKDWHGLLSLRKSRFNEDSLYVSSGSTERIATSKVLPSGGVVYDINDWTSVYYSYQKGLTPPQPYAMLANGSLLDPSITTGHEAGVKFELFDKRVALNANYYRSSANNIAIYTGIPNVYVATSGQDVDGIEISQVGKITPTLFLQTGLTYARSKGDIPSIGTPKYAFNVYLLKTFNLEDASKIEAGIGGNYQSSPMLVGTNMTTFLNYYTKLHTDYRRVNGSLAYTHGRYKVSLTIDNLLNRLNMYNANDVTALHRDTGRDVRLVMSVTLP